MTDTSSLSHLIERLEKATGPSRAMDVLIFGSVVDLVEGKPWSAADLQYASENPELSCNAPRYTSSIDAAMTLAKGMTCGFSGPIRKSSGVGHEGMFFGMCGSVPDDGFHIAVIAKTPAIALCIAALKAQLSTRTNEQDGARNLSGVSSE